MASLHLWDQYIASGEGGGDNQRIEKFWERRSDLFTATATALTAGGGRSMSGNREEVEQGVGSRLIGVLEQIRGILLADEQTLSEGGGHNKHESPPTPVFDGAGVLALSKLPFMVVQSTEDVFVNPR